MDITHYRKLKAPCAVEGCDDRDSIRHRFPKHARDYDIFKIWMQRVNNPKLAHKTRTQICNNAMLCDRHFTDDCRVPGWKKLRKRSVPTLFLPNYPEREDLDMSQIWPGESVTPIDIQNNPEDSPNLQMVEGYEIFRNIRKYDCRFVEFPNTTVSFALPSVSNSLFKSAPVLSSHSDSETEDGPDNETQNEDHNYASPETEENPPNHETQNLKKPDVNLGTVDLFYAPKKEEMDFALRKKPYCRSVKCFLENSKEIVEMCRICFRSLIQEGEYIKLYDSKEDSGQIKNMLKLVLPDLDLEMYRNNSICTGCLELIEYSYQLKEKWLETEDKLLKILKQKQDVISRQADLIVMMDNTNEEQTMENKVVDSDHSYAVQSIPQVVTNEEFLSESLNKENTPESNTSVVKEVQKEAFVFPDERDRFKLAVKRRPRQIVSQKRLDQLEMLGLGPYMCEQCGKIYPEHRQLKRHLREHAKPPPVKVVKEREYMCEICGRLFLNSNHLNKHSIVHVKFPCSICGKVFPQKFRLLDHVRCKHVGNLFQCHLCGKQLSYRTSLKLHLATVHNTKAKVYSCTACDKRFAFPSRLKKHLRYVHMIQGKTQECQYCGRLLKHEKSLRKHIDIYHMNQAKFVCEYCGKPYWKKVDMEKHKTRKHGWFPNAPVSNFETEVYTESEDIVTQFED